RVGGWVVNLYSGPLPILTESRTPPTAQAGSPAGKRGLPPARAQSPGPSAAPAVGRCGGSPSPRTASRGGVKHLVAGGGGGGASTRVPLGRDHLRRAR